MNGQKSAWISNGTVATNSMLFCNMDPSMGFDGGGICLVDLTQSGVSRGRPLDKLGQRDLPQGEIYFDDAVVPTEHFISDPESYTMMTDMVVALANAHMGAFFTGVARSAYDLALQYSTETRPGRQAPVRPLHRAGTAFRHVQKDRGLPSAQPGSHGLQHEHEPAPIPSIPSPPRSSAPRAHSRSHRTRCRCSAAMA